MNRPIQYMNDGWLVKYLAGEASPEEITAIEEWRNANSANEKHFQQALKIWEESISIAPQLNVDTEKSWARFQQKIHRPKAKTIDLSLWRSAAAVFGIIVLSAIAYYLFLHKQNTGIEVVAMNNTKTDTLPDGSIVVLNKHSSISYAGKFDGDERRVRMTGEAFFTVTHNPQRPFIVEFDNSNVKVVGTSFNIKTGLKGAEVIVETGRVIVNSKNQSGLLQAGEKGFINGTSGLISKSENTDRLYSYYRNRIFICNNTPLSSLVIALNNAYDTPINIANPQLDSIPITTTFNNQPLDSVLLLISETLSVKVEKNNGHIVLR